MRKRKIHADKFHSNFRYACRSICTSGLCIDSWSFSPFLRFMIKTINLCWFLFSHLIPLSHSKSMPRSPFLSSYAMVCLVRCAFHLSIACADAAAAKYNAFRCMSHKLAKLGANEYLWPSGGNPIKIPLNTIILHEHSQFDGINCNPKIPNHFNALRFIFPLPFVGIADGAKKNVTKKMLSTKKKLYNVQWRPLPHTRCCCTHSTIGKCIQQKT